MKNTMQAEAREWCAAIRTPLNTISLGIVLLAHPLLTEADRVRTLERIGRAVTAIDRLTREATCGASE